MQLQATPNPIQDTREVMAFNFMIVLFSAMVWKAYDLLFFLLI